MKNVLALVICVGVGVALASAQVVRPGEGSGRQQGDEKRRGEYLADMVAAGRAVGGDDLAEARRLLQKWRPATKQDADYRAWEWHFLDGRCREVGFYVKGHDCPVQAVAWSPGGDKLASADRQGVVKVWSVAGGKNQPEDKMKAPAAVLALGWSADGKLVVACHATVQVWEPGSGRAARTLPDPDKIPAPVRMGHIAQHTLFDTWMTSVAWSPDARKLALGDASGNVKLWDMKADEGTPLLGTHEGGTHCVAWNPSGTQLVSVGGDGVVKVWDPAKRKPLGNHPACKPKTVFNTPSFALTWSNDGRYLRVASAEGDVHELDAKSGTEVRVPRLVPRDALAGAWPMVTTLRRFVWAPGGKLLASIVPPFGPFSGTSDLQIWDVQTSREVLSFPAAWSIAKPGLLERNDEAVGCAPAFDGSGRRLAVGTDKGIVRTWDVGPGRRAVRSLILSPYSTAWSWSADSKHIFWATDVTVDDLLAMRKKQRDWDEKVKKQPGPIKGLPPPPPGSAFPVPPGQSQSPLAGQVENAHQRIQVYDAVTGAVAHTWDTKEKNSADNLAASPDGKWLACATGDALQLRPAKGGGPPKILEGPPKAASAGPRAPKPGPPVPKLGPPPNQKPGEGLVMCWAPDGKLLAHATGLGTAIRVWDPNTGKARTLERHGKALRSLAWSPEKEGKLLASADDEGTVEVWDVARGKLAFPFKYVVRGGAQGFGFGKPLASSVLSWSPDGKRLAVAGEDETIMVWDVDKKKEVATLPGNPAKGAHQVVCAVAWSPDGRRLAAASPDETFLLYDTATWKAVLTLRPVSGTFAALVLGHAGTLAWSPDGTQLALFGGGGSITIWDATPEEDKPGRQQGAATGAAAPKAKPAPQEPDENSVAAALEKVGAGIRRDEKRPGRPVVWVELTSKTQVTDADLRGVTNLKSLQTLNLGVTRVTDACLKEVKDLKDLQALQVAGTQVTDEGLKNVAGLQELQILNLAATRVTDAGLENLKGLKRLRLLDLTATQVTDAGLKHIREALPQCRVIK